MEFMKREAKRSRKKKKHHVFPPDKPTDSQSKGDKGKLSRKTTWQTVANQGLNLVYVKRSV